MIRPVRPDEESALQAFLASHAATSMFLRGNLAEFGLDGPPHPHRTTFWRWPADGPIRAAFGRTQSGMLLCQAPGEDAAITDFAQALHGQAVTGASGEAGQIDRLIAALSLPTTDALANHREPLFHLNLDRLPAAPPGAPALRRPVAADLPLLTGWFAAYLRDTGIAPPDPDRAAAETAARARAALDGAPLRLLQGPDGPLAMASLNARAADMIQVGGVYVPAPLRGRGLGREVTRALLAEARTEGARWAVLFANNTAAARAYQSIGFAQIGWYRILLLKGPVRAGEMTT